MSDIVERLRRHISLDELDADDQVANVPRWEVEEAAAEIERLRSPEACWWVHIDSDFYESQCGGVFQFTDGGPHDNAFTHCPFCGKPLEVGVQEEDGDE